MKKSTLIAVGAGIAGAFIVSKVIAKRHEEDSSIDDDNKYIKVSSAGEDNSSDSSSSVDNSHDAVVHTEKAVHTPSTYEKIVKPALDSILSFAGLAILSPIYGLISIAIKIDDPGPVFFTQKRVGKDKHYFFLHKFRTMKMSTPHDVPTHQLENPEQYITRVGAFLRRTSLDELPQIWDIWRGKMSVIGPRPALWNQADLVAERDKYAANDVLPGLTGWAQINGRDELEILVKARLDGEYVRKLSFGMDLRCFVGTVFSVLKHDGVVEGGTGTINNTHQRDREVYGEDEYQIRSPFPLRPGLPAEDPETDWDFKKTFDIDKNKEISVLITGADSYIGTSFKEYVKEHYPNITVTSVDMQDSSWGEGDWSGFDTVFHVAGIAHADVENVDEATKELYYSVNTDLAIEAGRKAKEGGVKQFIFMSSMILYGGAEYIDCNTIPAPSNFYRDSKWQADKGLREMGSENFRVAVLRPSMIYSKGSKGNYPTLAKIAKKTPVFPKVSNKRSMLYIENLCEFVAELILSGEGGVYVPQNVEYSNTGELVKSIGAVRDKKVRLSKALSPVVFIADHVPGKIGKLSSKAFGSSYYDQELSQYRGLDYQKITLAESIERTEGEATPVKTTYFEKLSDLKGKRVLLIALPGYREGILRTMLELGADADCIADKPNDGFWCKTLGRLGFEWYQKVITDYYAEQIDEHKGRDYDYILAIRGEYTTAGALGLLREAYPNAKLILYIWDGLHKQNTKGIEKKWSLYDKVYTFDRIDYEANKGRIEFLPLFYYDEYLPKQTLSPNSDDFKYDLSFVGTGHEDRIPIVKEIMAQGQEAGLRCFSYFFMPHPIVFYKNKAFDKNFKNVHKSDVKFEMVPFEKLYDTYANSRCIVDVENAGQHGLTMRSIEILGLKRKFITTNKDIVNYDFYNPSNILVIDRENPKIDMSFFEKPYEMLSKELYEKYSLKNWILEVLK